MNNANDTTKSEISKKRAANVIAPDKKQKQSAESLEAQGTDDKKTEFNRNDFSEREYKENSFGEYSDDSKDAEDNQSERQPPSDII